MKTLKSWAILVAVTCLYSVSSGQSYQKRLALIIGNSSYQHGGALRNPVNDARAMAGTLQSMGFEVMKYEDLSSNDMKRVINEFGKRLAGNDVGLFYYAGHGIQHNGTNYMIPIEANLQNEEQIEFDCVSADRVVSFMETAKAKVNVIIMDACRNNPFERSWRRSTNGNGLAMMNAPSGTLIAYATAPGTTAADGDGINGLYTSAILKYIKDESLTIEQVFKKSAYRSGRTFRTDADTLGNHFLKRRRFLCGAWS
ncbi:caspase family protein [Oscillatoria amoena NRMC-F 0135]|nr:caspase family protein [Oscillatoria amoena NRMC-F 0135]